MIFPRETYDAMIALLRQYIYSAESSTEILPDVEESIKLGVPHDSLLSLYGQLLLRRADEEFHRLRRSEQESIIQRLIYRVQCGESLRKISRELSIGSYKVAKLYIERVKGTQFKLSTFLSQPAQIEDEALRFDLLKMISEDPSSSVEADLAKESVGKDYEELLISLLRDRLMCFETEEESRSKGKPKTPDVLFSVPMATPRSSGDLLALSISNESFHAANTAVLQSNIYLNRGKSVRTALFQDNDVSLENNSIANNSSESFAVVHWIDSKAMFADIRTFSEHLPQLESYRNRYGRGMVIYWQGVCEDVYSSLVDDMILVRDAFPEKWIWPTGEVALSQGRPPQFDSFELLDASVDNSNITNSSSDFVTDGMTFLDGANW